MCAHHQGSGFSKMWRICALITSSCASTDARDNVSRTTCGVLVCATIDYLELRWSAPAAVRWRRRGATAQARKGRAADGGGEQAHCHERGARGHEPGAPHDRRPAGLGGASAAFRGGPPSFFAAIDESREWNGSEPE
jgi:hypothetical protein